MNTHNRNNNTIKHSFLLDREMNEKFYNRKTSVFNAIVEGVVFSAIVLSLIFI